MLGACSLIRPLINPAETLLIKRTTITLLLIPLLFINPILVSIQLKDIRQIKNKR